MGSKFPPGDGVSSFSEGPRLKGFGCQLHCADICPPRDARHKFVPCCHGTRRATESFLRERPAASRTPRSVGSVQDHLPSMRLTVSRLSPRHTIWILWPGLPRVAPQRDTSEPRRARREQEPVVDTGSGTTTVVSGASAGVRKSYLVQSLAPRRSREVLRKV